ncbi:STAS domain-containing protein, partial [bacterium]|nr:STAS domain-containing protein [bacterium]
DGFFLSRVEIPARATSPQAEKYINELIDEGIKNIIFDFEALDMISSTGLRLILATVKKLNRVKGKVVISGPNFSVNDVLRISGFRNMFDVLDSVVDSLGKF